MSLTGREPPRDICDRTFEYGVRVTNLCKQLEQKGWIGRKIGSQLFDAGTSVGANVQEGQAGQSKKDFISKYAIALKEVRESVYWMRLSVASETIGATQVTDLMDEGIQISKILGKSLVTAQSNNK